MQPLARPHQPLQLSTQAVVTGADNWSPFAALAHEPTARQQPGGSPLHNMVVSGAPSPRAAMLDTAGLVPNFAGPRTVTTAPILGGAATDAAARKEAQAARGRRGASRSPRGPAQASGAVGMLGEESTGESNGMRQAAAAAALAAGNGMSEGASREGDATCLVKKESLPDDGGEGLGLGPTEGSTPLRMSLRRRASTRSGAGAAGGRSPGATGRAGSAAADSLWLEEDLEALLGQEDEDEEGLGAAGDESDDEDESPKLQTKRKVQVGRPLKYKGDPNAPHLTEEERRRIKRRIANRESARRVRQKRNELMDDLQCRAQSLTQQNGRLLAHVAGLEQQNRNLTAQLGLLRDKYAAKVGENLQLYNALLHAKRLLVQLGGARSSSGELTTAPSLPAQPGFTGGVGGPSGAGAGGTGSNVANPSSNPLGCSVNLGPANMGSGSLNLSSINLNNILGGSAAGLLQPSSAPAQQPTSAAHFTLPPPSSSNPAPAAPAAVDATAHRSCTPPLLPMSPLPPTSAAASDPALCLPGLSTWLPSSACGGAINPTSSLGLHSSSSSLQLADFTMLDLPPLSGLPLPQPTATASGTGHLQPSAAASPQQQCGGLAGGEPSRAPTPFSFL